PDILTDSAHPELSTLPLHDALPISYLMRNLEAREPASLEVCALMTKPGRREIEVPVRYVGFEIPNRFVVGYGLDFAERYRNLPRSEEHTSELQSRGHLVCRLLLEKK